MTIRAVVLICARDPMIGGLLGMLAELAGLHPAFPATGESLDDALGRVKPILAVVLEDTLDEAQSELFVARAARRQVAVALFGVAARGVPDASKLRQAIPWFEIPRDAAAFRRMVDVARQVEWWRGTRDRRARDVEPRRMPRNVEPVDGPFVYRDTEGRRWRVYDRRGAERRQLDERRDDVRVGGRGIEPESEATPASTSPFRVFVNDRGERWQCALDESEVAQRSEAALGRQLARSTPV